MNCIQKASLIDISENVMLMGDIMFGKHLAFHLSRYFQSHLLQMCCMMERNIVLGKLTEYQNCIGMNKKWHCPKIQAKGIKAQTKLLIRAL